MLKKVALFYRPIRINLPERYGNLSNYGAFADDLTQFKYAYAVIANRDGVQHSKKDDVPNATAINKAFELATGGVYVQEPDYYGLVHSKPAAVDHLKAGRYQNLTVCQMIDLKHILKKVMQGFLKCLAIPLQNSKIYA
ncbi:hypothetical protein ACO1DV_15840 [Acinetobacter lwoffii]|uniref:hypothetical protein n=1 Tax=Acinetobacter lwoffii TaxID=28090 RepID=UPI003BF6D7AF